MTSLPVTDGSGEIYGLYTVPHYTSGRLIFFQIDAMVIDHLVKAKF